MPADPTTSYACSHCLKTLSPQPVEPPSVLAFCSPECEQADAARVAGTERLLSRRHRREEIVDVLKRLQKGTRLDYRRFVAALREARRRDGRGVTLHRDAVSLLSSAATIIAKAAMECDRYPAHKAHRIGATLHARLVEIVDGLNERVNPDSESQTGRPRELGPAVVAALESAEKTIRRAFSDAEPPIRSRAPSYLAHVAVLAGLIDKPEKGAEAIRQRLERAGKTDATRLDRLQRALNNLER